MPPRSGGGAGEVRVKRPVADIHPHRDRQIGVVHPVTLERIRGGESRGRHAPQRLARAALCVDDEVPGRVPHRRPPVALHERPHPIRAALDRRPLRCEVGPAGVRRAHVSEQEPLDFGRQPDRRQDDPLGEDLPRARRHAARLNPSHVGMVRPDDAVTTHGALDLDRADERDVR